MLARRRQASAWQDITRDTKATIFAPLTPATDIADAPGEIFSDVAVGFSVQTPDGQDGTQIALLTLSRSEKPQGFDRTMSAFQPAFLESFYP